MVNNSVKVKMPVFNCGVQFEQTYYCGNIKKFLLNDIECDIQPITERDIYIFNQLQSYGVHAICTRRTALESCRAISDYAEYNGMHLRQFEQWFLEIRIYRDAERGDLCINCATEWAQWGQISSLKNFAHGSLHKLLPTLCEEKNFCAQCNKNLGVLRKI